GTRAGRGATSGRPRGGRTDPPSARGPAASGCSAPPPPRSLPHKKDLVQEERLDQGRTQGTEDRQHGARLAPGRLRPTPQRGVVRHFLGGGRPPQQLPRFPAAQPPALPRHRQPAPCPPATGG